MNKRVNCLKCRHYGLTWDKRFPYTCKLLGFKSPTMPSVLAYNSTGKPCEGFQDKTVSKQAESANAATNGVIVSIGNREGRV